MATKLTKYIPPNMRLEIAQDVIEEKGIRPLARKLDVNPKSVYKYKQGSAHPGDEVMAKILAAAGADEKIALRNYLENLREDFLDALEVDFDTTETIEEEKEELTDQEGEAEESGEAEGGTEEEESVDQETTEGGSVVQETTEGEKKQSSVDEEPTKKLRLGDVFNKIDVTKPFNQSKVEKILNTLSEEPNSTLEEIMDISNLSQEAVEKYLERMESENLVTKNPQGSYKLVIEFFEEN